MYMHCNNNVQKPFISNMKRICTNRSYCIKAYNDNDETSNQAQTLNVYVHDVNTRSIKRTEIWRECLFRQSRERKLP